MPLPILIPAVVAGLAVIALLLRLGARPPRALPDPEAAREAWLRRFPDDTVREVILSRNRHAALILADEGRGLLWSAGAGPQAHRLEDYDLIDRGTALRVIFHDVTGTEVTLRLDDFEARRWRSLLGAA
ncbi:MAG: hypothetical protein AB7S99_01860 [Pseudodonghicola sp.]